MKATACSSILLLAFVDVGLAQAREQQSSFTRIAAPGFLFTMPSAVNNHGVVVGMSTQSELCGVADSPGFIYANGAFSYIRIADALFVSPSAINDAGAIVGIYGTPDGQQHAFLYRGGEIESIGENEPGFMPTDINNRGVIVGYAAWFVPHVGLQWRPMIGDSDGFQELPAVDGWFEPTPTTITASGAVLGHAWVDTGTFFEKISWSFRHGTYTIIGAGEVLTANDRGDLLLRTESFHRAVYRKGVPVALEGLPLEADLRALSNSQGFMSNLNRTRSRE